MSSWSRARPEEFLRLDLEAHAVLSRVPLHDVWRVDLPGGGVGRTVDDVRRLMSFESVAESNPIVRSLFALRGWMGRAFGWDDEHESTGPRECFTEIPAELAARSKEKPGTTDGPFVLVYALDFEAMSEIRNATVQAWSVVALQPLPDGYRAWWAIYVEPVNRLTPFYMALIAPFRRFLVYPAILRQVHRAWVAEYT